MEINLMNLNRNIIEIIPTDQISSIDDLIPNFLELRHDLREKGVIRLKGFNIDSSSKFKKMALLFSERLISKNGEHIPDPNVEGVFMPVNYSEKKKLLWHNENSFNDTWPLTIMFACILPAEIGGETPIVDSRKILMKLNPTVLEEFTRKNVMYIRSHGFGLGLSWQKIYNTESKCELEQICRKKNVQIEWKGDDQLITKQVRQAVVQHPLTGEKSWFNQVQHWHPFCLDALLRKSLMKQFTFDTLPRNCCFGDGSPIPDDMIKHILEVYQALEITFSWAKGDVLILDNVLFAHARNPYSGARKLLVSMGC